MKEQWGRGASCPAIFPVTCMLMMVLLMLGSGCISFHRGYCSTSTKSDSQRIETETGVSNIILTARAESGKVITSCSALVSSRSIERNTTTNHRRERKLVVGLIPGTRREMEIEPDAAWYPCAAVIKNIVFLFIPTVSSLFIAPFGDYDDSKGRPMSDMGLIGVARYTVSAPPQVTVKDRLIEDDIRRRAPLKGIRITCSIPELSFTGTGTTDRKGECVFAVDSRACKSTAITLTITDTSGSSSSHLGPYNGFTRQADLVFLP